ncbi:MAG: hypothetical protein M1839_008464 [Geoglossum umbratile]|nr:MAG: hypothetical protein M1839_008464 [Geoglossum umbratile]
MGFERPKDGFQDNEEAASTGEVGSASDKATFSQLERKGRSRWMCRAADVRHTPTEQDSTDESCRTSKTSQSFRNERGDGGLLGEKVKRSGSWLVAEPQRFDQRLAKAVETALERAAKRATVLGTTPETSPPSRNAPGAGQRTATTPALAHRIVNRKGTR